MLVPQVKQKIYEYFRQKLGFLDLNRWQFLAMVRLPEVEQKVPVIAAARGNYLLLLIYLLMITLIIIVIILIVIIIIVIIIIVIIVIMIMIISGVIA